MRVLLQVLPFVGAFCAVVTLLARAAWWYLKERPRFGRSRAVDRALERGTAGSDVQVAIDERRRREERARIEAGEEAGR